MSDKVIVRYPDGCEYIHEAIPDERGVTVFNESKIIAPEGKEIIVSDGYHNFEELYDHRIELFITLCRALHRVYEVDHCIEQFEIWRSKKHTDGSSYEGWFILGIHKERGEQISYHLPMSRWEDCDFAETLDTVPDFDGHTAADVLERLKKI
jgi:hypothetical protein